MWDWEELQGALRAGSSPAWPLQDQEGVEGKVTAPGKTLSPSIGSLGQQEFLGEFPFEHLLIELQDIYLGLFPHSELEETSSV